MEPVTFVELPAFTRRVQELMEDGEYRRFQLALIEDPLLGKAIPGCGGLRKIRWQGSGRGKRGGVRVIYYWARTRGEVLLLYAYPKSERDDLTPEQKRQLRRVVKEEYP